MESKNVYIILAVVIVLGGGFFGYRHFSGGQTTQAHHEDTYARLTEMANKSPRAGLIQMGRALKKYHEAMNGYPNNLSELYPDYISGRSFIDDVNWNYQAGGNNFLLTKSVERGGKTLVASIDNSLKAKIGSGTRVARVARKRPTPPPSTSTKVAGASGLKLPTGMELLASLRAPTIDSQDTEKIDSLAPVRQEARIVSINDSETPSELTVAVARNYLVWRDDQGNLGFGNVQYPSVREFAAASTDNWFSVKRTISLESEMGQADAKTLDQKQVSNNLAFTLQNQYLAWKDSDGFIGFGNVQYPSANQFAVASTDDWVDFKRKSVDVSADDKLKVLATQEKSAEDAVSLGIQGQYMAWRDKNGTIGFGNVQYPGKDDIDAVYVDGEWQKFEKKKSL